MKTIQVFLITTVIGGGFLLNAQPAANHSSTVPDPTPGTRAPSAEANPPEYDPTRSNSGTGVSHAGASSLASPNDRGEPPRQNSDGSQPAGESAGQKPTGGDAAKNRGRITSMS